MRQYGRRLARLGAGLATAAALTAGGFATDAQAVIFNNSDIIFAIYGNDIEYVRNLGAATTLLAPNATTEFQISPSDLAASMTPIAPATVPNTLKWSIYSHNLDGDGQPVDVKYSSAKPLASVTQQEMNTTNAFLESVAGRGVNFQGLQGSRQVNPDLIPRTNPASFSAKFGQTGSLGGIAWGTLGGLDTERPLFQTLFDGKVYSEIGRAILSADGLTLTVTTATSPVPVPAAVVLFGTGLVGLVGVARRSLAK